jgi:DUF4097 and DUF4098 domain-containing protein YvlB
MRHALFATALTTAGLVLASTTPAAGDRTIDETLELAADGELTVEVLSGNLVVRGWERAEMRVTGRVGDDVDDLDIGGDGNRAWIDLDSDHRSGRVDLDVDLEIWLPATARLEVDTVSAGIDVSDVGGALELGSVSGEITVSGSPSSLDAETVSGNVRLSGSSGGTSVSIETVSGSVNLRGVAGGVDASSVSGDIELTGVAPVTSVDLEAVSGSIALDAALAPGARVGVSSHSGSIVLTLPAGTSASFDVTTFSGSVENELGPAAQRIDRFGPGKSLEFTLGEGSAQVVVETFSGSVSLARR